MPNAPPPVSGTAWPIFAPKALAIFFTFLAIAFVLNRKLDFQVVSVDDQADGTLTGLLTHLHQQFPKRVHVLFNGFPRPVVPLPVTGML